MAEIQNPILFGDGETPANITAGTQVKFAITKTTGKAGSKGTAGSGYIEFAEAAHTIYVDGVKFGATDAAGNDIAGTYITIADASAEDASIRWKLDASIKDVLNITGGNFANLRIFQTIGGVDASSNSAELDFVGQGITIAKTTGTGDSSIQFTVNAATAEVIGGVKSGNDITVGTDGGVTVQKIQTQATANSQEYSIIASGTGNSQDLRTVSGLTVNTDASGGVSVRYTGRYVHNNDIATKADVDAVVLSAVNGMHYRGTINAAADVPTTTDASTGDFYVVNFDGFVGELPVQAGDYIICSGADKWDVVNRNITEATSIEGADDNAIPTVSAVTSFVNTQISTNQLENKWFKTFKVGDSSVVADSSNDDIEFVAGTGITLSVDATDDKITFAHSIVTTDASTATAVNLTSGSDSFTILKDVSINNGHVVEKVTQTIDVAGAVTSRISNTATKSNSVNTTYSQNVLSNTLFWEVEADEQTQQTT